MTNTWRKAERTKREKESASKPSCANLKVLADAARSHVEERG
jgi:hypothetical protein